MARRNSAESKARHAEYIEARPLPSDPCKWSQTATERIYAKLGAENRTLPRTLKGRFNIDGWTIIVKPGWSPPLAAQGKSSKPRLFVEVEKGRLVPAGRVAQALCTRLVERARTVAARHRGAGGRFKYL